MDILKTQQLQHFHGNTARRENSVWTVSAEQMTLATNAFSLDKENEDLGKCFSLYPPLALQTSRQPAGLLSPGKKKTFESSAQFVLIAEVLGT